MKPAIKPTLLFGALLLLIAPASADEVKLKDGRVLVGKVTEIQRGKARYLEIQTRDGIVRVAEEDVAENGRRTDLQLREALTELEQGVADTPHARLQLAIQARAWGLEPELWQHLGAALKIPDDAEHAGQRARLRDFMAQLEPELLPRRFATASTSRRVDELLRQHRRNEPVGRYAALVELLTRELDAEKDLRIQARRNSDPNRRLLAVDALLARVTPGNDRFAWRTSILDPNDAVRARALELAADRGATQGAVDYLAPGLMHSSSEVRVRTAEAFANLGAKAAVQLLVVAGPNAGKALAAADEGVRAHIAFINQQAYIQDFDVEVAQASFIADPKIGILQSGSVLDVTVQGVFEQQVIIRAYRSALQRLAGSDPGPRPSDWATWLAGLSAQKPATPGTPTPGTKGRQR